MLTLELAIPEEHGLMLPPAVAGLREQGSDELALEGAERYAAGVGQSQAAAQGATGLHPGVVWNWWRT